MKRLFALILSIAVLLTFFVSCEKEGASAKKTVIVFGDLSWDSAQVHNRIAAYIIENGLDGYEAEYMAGDTVPIMNGIIQGDVDVDMESWHKNVPEIYRKGIESGNMIDLGENLPDGPQGWWVPRYVVEGPDAVAPGLKSVEDLPNYASLFKDPEDPSKGVVYAGVAGWGQLTTSEEIFETYKLKDTFNMSIAGSGSALAGTMVGADKKREPWVGYYWAPTAVMGKLDMVRLEGSEFPKADINILVNSSMLEKAPEVVEMLKKYSTSVEDNNEVLALMDQNEWDTTQAAEWFLKNKEDVWTEWVDASVAEKVKAALQG
ncbi:MAG: ABC transporter substrate-binding protein [Spirochaetales bacterium]|nr:ABC transporter substrate-binding protein [Spirochaetales bacterium]